MISLRFTYRCLITTMSDHSVLKFTSQLNDENVLILSSMYLTLLPLISSLRFNGHFPGESGLAGVY